VDVNVDVANAKRGEVTTGKGADTVSVSIQTNNANWSNQFNIDTGAGDDTITVSNSVNSKFTSVNIDGGSGNDTIDISGLEAAGSDVERIVDGGLGDDSIIGSRGDDAINSGAGNDKIVAGHGDDTIHSGAGNDRIWADHGNDTIYAGEGNDKIKGGAGDDVIFAGEGNDEVLFDSADSSIDGGQGFDSLVVSFDANIINAVGFEAIISNNNKMVANHVVTDLQDGLMVALGGDEGDILSFNQDVIFTSLSQTYSELLAETGTNMDSGMLDLFKSQGYNDQSVSALNGYEASTGEIIWTDVDFLA
jgi:Ca2+-binding RTX toxin-like protein